MLRKLLFLTAALVAAAGLVFWLLTMPRPLDESVLAGTEPGDPVRGERMYFAGGCASCHASPEAEGVEGELGGGLVLTTDFGAFVAPNISPHPQDGIGDWSEMDFANAMLRGISPEGNHYYPAYPYTSYARMEVQDVRDIFAYLKSLPPVEGRADSHKIAFPFTLRRGIGLWKRLYLSAEPVVTFPEGTPENVLRGRYLVEGPGHCGECHTPRNFIGGLKLGQWLEGGPAAEGEGRVPGITPDEDGIGFWSEGDIAYFLESGFTPDFDSVGGAMVAVQKNMARLPAEDRESIAAYLKAIGQ
ncbi:cytochrome c [Chelativorans sp. Marseille-P2723]|uniref:cytochrome c n=1 Tax=Chelativorans sp. Marseille-P2723 TaxID=2709133 RepID=UPI00156ED646|nr:cytochrome c [Chelativorans sp. Marseille-P2723]